MVAVGGALLSLEKANVIQAVYWVASAIAIAFGLHDRSDYPPLEVVVKDARTSHVVLRYGPPWESILPIPCLNSLRKKSKSQG